MSRAEKIWLCIATVVIVMAAAAPYIAGWVSAPPDQPFSGVLVAREDVYSYLANMRLGASGRWLFQNEYATEPHPETPLYSVYLLLGHIAAPGVDARIPLGTLAVVYSIARAAFGGMFLVVLYWFIAQMVTDVAVRRLAWLLIAVGGGLGWLLILITGDTLPFGAPPLDMYLGEANTIIPLLSYPHTLLARSALLLGLGCLLRADAKNDWRLCAAASGLWLVAALAVPFEVLIAGGIVAGWIGARWLMTRIFPLKLVVMGLVAGIPGAALNIVTLAIMGTDPVYASWTAQNLLPLPPLIHMLSAFGLPAALAIPGAIYLWREKSPHADMLIGWLVAAPLLTLIPLPFQLRFIEGFAIPSGLLAIIGLRSILVGLPRRAGTTALFVALLPTTLLLVIGGIASALGGLGRYSADQAAMLDWLRKNAVPDSVAMSSEETGVMLPAAAPVRAVLGHGFETPDFDETQVVVQSLYSGKLDAEQARAWITSHRVRYIIVGPDEAVMTGPSKQPLIDTLDLRVVFSQGEYHIYETGSP